MTLEDNADAEATDRQARVLNENVIISNVLPLK